jgi:hypothetical protein
VPDAEADRWLSLFTAVPSLPATPAEALTTITATQAASHSLFELSLASGFELHANGELPLSLPCDPIGRAIVVGLEPGTR